MNRNRLLTLALALPAVLLIIWFSVHASSETANHSAPPNTVPSGPSDWPQWRGPERNGVSKDTGLIKQWPSSGPQQAWSISSLGEGFGSIAIKGDRIFVQGTREDLSVIFCLNRADGKTVWSAALGRKVNEGRGNGPRSTPTVDNDRVYVLTENGDLACLRAPDGAPVWRKNILKEFGGSNPGWLISESPLIDGDRVIVTPGGRGAGMVALDKMTGQRDLEGERPERWGGLFVGHCG
jgi:outer membrane protein assembly factor BamB